MLYVDIWWGVTVLTPGRVIQLRESLIPLTLYHLMYSISLIEVHCWNRFMLFSKLKVGFVIIQFLFFSLTSLTDRTSLSLDPRPFWLGLGSRLELDVWSHMVLYSYTVIVKYLLEGDWGRAGPQHKLRTSFLGACRRAQIYLI